MQGVVIQGALAVNHHLDEALFRPTVVDPVQLHLRAFQLSLPVCRAKEIVEPALEMHGERGLGIDLDLQFVEWSGHRSASGYGFITGRMEAGFQNQLQRVTAAGTQLSLCLNRELFVGE